MPNLSINLNKVEAEQMWIDITKFLTVAITIHVLLYVVDDYGELFGETALKLFLYLTLGFIFYHSIVKKLVDKHIINKNCKENDIVKEKPKTKTNIKTKRKKINKKKNTKN